MRGTINGMQKAEKVRFISADKAKTTSTAAPETGSPVSAEYYLPKNTAGFLASAGGLKIENTALCVEKYIRVNQNLKRNINRTFSDCEIKLLDKINAQIKSMLGFYSYTAEAELKSRMVVGLGAPSVFETGIILHKPYGFPYIPGSSVKGAMRSFLQNEHSDKYDDAALDKLFGAQGSRGGLIFFDAYPVSIKELELDIMNPHYSKWYAEGNPPVDTYDPVPVLFYTVPKGTRFIFRISGTTDNNFKTAFNDMLQYAGLGAKTAAGYGWFGIKG